MAYQTYTTTALVCGSFARNTSDKSFLLFTELLGMVTATARSVREERSRQRCALQDFSLIRVSLVKGRAGWRIGSVVVEKNYFSLANERVTRGYVTRIIRLLRRFVQGEESSEVLFGVVHEALESITKAHIQYPEVYFEAVVFRVLYELGYIAPTKQQQYLTVGPLTALDQLRTEKDRAAVQMAVSDALAVSHL